MANKAKITNNDIQNITQKTTDGPKANSGAPEGLAVPAP